MVAGPVHARELHAPQDPGKGCHTDEFERADRRDVERARERRAQGDQSAVVLVVVAWSVGAAARDVDLERQVGDRGGGGEAALV